MGSIRLELLLDLRSIELMNFTLLVKTLESGQVAASVLELPGYRVEAASKEVAIDRLRTTLIDHLDGVEASAWQLPVELPAPVTSPWGKMFGAFKDDVYFDEVMAIIQADRDALRDDELDPAYYMNVNVIRNSSYQHFQQ